jgi:valyl-tRNA synthetase
MSELLCREATLKYELDCLNQELRKVKTNIDKASIDNEYFTKITNESSLKSTKFYDKEIKFLKEKSQQYKKLIESLQTELIDNDFSEDIQHRVLKQHYQDTLSLERQLQPIQSQLGNFADLPPDITLAKLKVYESKLELERLEKELAQHIDLIHLEN